MGGVDRVARRLRTRACRRAEARRRPTRVRGEPGSDGRARALPRTRRGLHRLPHRSGGRRGARAAHGRRRRRDRQDATGGRSPRRAVRRRSIAGPRELSRRQRPVPLAIGHRDVQAGPLAGRVAGRRRRVPRHGRTSRVRRRRRRSRRPGEDRTSLRRRRARAGRRRREPRRGDGRRVAAPGRTRRPPGDRRRAAARVGCLPVDRRRRGRLRARRLRSPVSGGDRSAAGARRRSITAPRSGTRTAPRR